MRYDVGFILAGIFYLIAGEALGTWMGINEDFLLAPVHAHINLLGWVTLTLFGLAYRAYPALAVGWLAGAHFATAVVGSGAMGVGIYFSVVLGEHNFVAVATLAVLASTAFFLANFLIKVAFARGRRAQPHSRQSA